LLAAIKFWDQKYVILFKEIDMILILTLTTLSKVKSIVPSYVPSEPYNFCLKHFSVSITVFDKS